MERYCVVSSYVTVALGRFSNARYVEPTFLALEKEDSVKSMESIVDLLARAQRKGDIMDLVRVSVCQW